MAAESNPASHISSLHRDNGLFLPCIRFLLVVSFSFSIPLYVFAAPPDINGGYSGTLAGTETCTPPNPDPAFTTDLTFTITQNGTSFTGSGSFVDDGAETGSFEFVSATVDDNGNVSGSLNVFPDGDVNQTGTFSGSFSNNQLSLSINVTEDSPGTCSSTGSGTFTRSTSGDIVVIDPEITPSNILTTPFLLNTQVKAMTSDMSYRISDVLRGSPIGIRQTANGLMWEGQSTGLNAGDAFMNIGIWGSYSYSDFDNDFVSTAFDGHRHNILTGIDFQPRENMLLGVAVGYDNSDIDTGFNRGNQDIDGITVAPYFGYLFDENWSIDVSAGYSRVESDQYRTDPNTNNRVNSSPTADRWFAMLNLNGYTQWQNWLFRGHVGTLLARNYQHDFRESDGTRIDSLTTKLGQVNAGGEASYIFGEFEPFARFAYEYDYSMSEIVVLSGGQPSNDNDNFLVGAGLRYFSQNGLSGNLEWNRRVDREDYNEDTFMATLRKDF